jgi:hypothetical protein
VACEGALGLPLRVDLVTISGGEVGAQFRIDSGRMITFAPFSFEWEGRLRVRLMAFTWDCLNFRVVPAREDWGPLVTWFREWFDKEGEGEAGTLGVVHFLSDPEAETDGTVRFQADLGTAPVGAFEGLLDAVAALGVAEVVVGGRGDEDSQEEGVSCSC